MRKHIVQLINDVNIIFFIVAVGVTTAITDYSYYHYPYCVILKRFIQMYRLIYVRMYIHENMHEVDITVSGE